jgi:phosphatidylglycerophosphatase A
MTRGGLRKWIVTFGGAGLSPVAPGTAGSFAAALLIYLLALTTADPLIFNLAISAVMLASGAACVALGGWTIEYFGRKDPGAMVLDEVAGVCLTMLFQPAAPTSARRFLTIVAVFVMFRVFDVLKPPPCRQLEKLPLGWGILMDDLMAGVYANVACQVLLRLI